MVRRSSSVTPGRRPAAPGGWTCRAGRRADRDPAHLALSDVAANLEAEGVAVESQGRVRVVMREEARVNGDLHDDHARCGSVTRASRFLIDLATCFATHGRIPAVARTAWRRVTQDLLNRLPGDHKPGQRLLLSHQSPVQLRVLLPGALHPLPGRSLRRGRRDSRGAALASSVPATLGESPGLPRSRYRSSLLVVI
jgi:hypothetical protein